MSTIAEIRESFEREYQGTRFESEIDSLVEGEAVGLLNSDRALLTWCTCADQERVSGESAYYRRDNGRHGWFHDPQLGGCGGITQTG